MSNQYVEGQQVRLKATINDGNDNQDPGGLTFEFRNPAGTLASYVYGTDSQLVREAAGVYYVALSLDTIGRWHYGFKASGAYQSAAGAELDVLRVA